MNEHANERNPQYFPIMQNRYYSAASANRPASICGYPSLWLEKRIREALAEPAEAVSVAQFKKNMKAIANDR
jgi:hypothetical protein